MRIMLVVARQVGMTSRMVCLGTVTSSNNIVTVLNLSPIFYRQVEIFCNVFVLCTALETT